MTRPVPLVAGLLGVLFLIIAAVYWLIPAGGLPSFFPGFEAGADQVHFKHGLVALIVAIVLLAVAWFQSEPERR
jgi:hypothetical protein